MIDSTMPFFLKFTLFSILVSHAPADVVRNTQYVSSVNNGGYEHSIPDTTELEEFIFKGHLRVGEKATAKCKVSKGIGPYRFHLLKDSNQVMNTSRIQVQERLRARIIEINPLSMADAGNYTCYVTDLGTKKTISHNIELLVEDVYPVIAKNVRNITVSAGSNADLECDVKNIGVHRIRWTHLESSRLLTENNMTRIRDARYRLTVESSRNGLKWILHISNVTYEDIGQYWCEIDSTPPVIAIRYLDVTQAEEEGLPTIYKKVILILTGVSLALIFLGSCVYSCIYFKVTKRIRRSLRGDPRRLSFLRRQNSRDIHHVETIQVAKAKPLTKLKGVVAEKPSDVDLSKAVPAQIIAYQVSQTSSKK